MSPAGNQSPSRTSTPIVESIRYEDDARTVVSSGPATGPRTPQILYTFIYGTSEAEAIWGTESNDAIFGLGGANGRYNDGDYIYGFGGHDLIHGGDGYDYIDGGAGNDLLYGHQGNDTLLGDAGDDALSGGSGGDLLAGGAGNDYLAGGADADTFYFSVYNGPWGHDVIADFEDGLDKIRITGGINPFTFGDLTIFDTVDGAMVLLHQSSILLQGVSAQQLSAADFNFV